MKQKRIHRELKHQGHVVAFYEDTIDLGDGRCTFYDYIHHMGAAAVVPVTAAGEILLVRQWRNAFDRMIYEIPAGKLDPSEAPADCAARELREETGYEAKTLFHLFHFTPTVAYLDEFIEIYVAQDLHFVGQDLDWDESIDVQSFPLQEVIDMIFRGEIEDGKTIAAVLAYKERFLPEKNSSIRSM